MDSSLQLIESLPSEVEVQVMARAGFTCELCNRQPGEKMFPNARGKTLAACEPEQILFLCKPCYEQVKPWASIK